MNVLMPRVHMVMRSSSLDRSCFRSLTGLRPVRPSNRRSLCSPLHHGLAGTGLWSYTTQFIPSTRTSKLSQATAIGCSAESVESRGRRLSSTPRILERFINWHLICPEEVVRFAIAFALDLLSSLVLASHSGCTCCRG